MRTTMFLTACVLAVASCKSEPDQSDGAAAKPGKATPTSETDVDMECGDAMRKFWENMVTSGLTDHFAARQFRVVVDGMEDPKAARFGKTKGIVIEGNDIVEPSSGARLSEEQLAHTRVREIVSMRQPESGEELVDGNVLPLIGAVGDGKKDSIRFVAQVTGVADEEKPADYVVHLDVDQQTVSKTFVPKRQVEDGVWELDEVIELPFDPKAGKTYDLEPWVDLPEGGTSRWVYEDIGFEYLTFTISGPRVGGSQTYSVPTERVKLWMMRDETGIMAEPMLQIPPTGGAADMKLLTFILNFPGITTGSFPIGGRKLSIGIRTPSGPKGNCGLSPWCCNDTPRKLCNQNTIYSTEGTVKVERMERKAADVVLQRKGTGVNAVRGTFEAKINHSHNGAVVSTQDVEGSFSLLRRKGR